MLSISLLGTPAITLDGRPLPLTRRKSRAVLYYLAAQAQPLSREHLLAVFWPDLDRAAAQQTLRTTLHGLRKTLGAHLVIDDPSGLALASDLNVDVRDFAAQLQPLLSNRPPLTNGREAPGRLARPSWSGTGVPEINGNSGRLADILQRYRGDFLDGFTLPDSPAFDDWAAAEREHYRRLAVRGLTTLSRQFETSGDFDAALEALDRALAFDPLQEDLQRAAMRLHYLAGDRAAAIRRYDSLRKLLDDEMGVPPMTETRALYDAIINDALPGPPLTPSSSTPTDRVVAQPDVSPGPQSAAGRLDVPFIGREAELQTLHALTAAQRLVVIEGEPGIGKTRLAEEFITTSNALGLVGSAHELEQPLPYQPIIDALRGLLARPDWPALHAALRAEVRPVWLAELSRLLPEIDPGEALPPTLSEGAPWRGSRTAAPSPAGESQLWEGLHQFLRALAARHPVIFFIDDVQWADASTLAWLGYVVRQAPAPILYLAAARPADPRSPLAVLLQTLTREERLTRLPLARLKPGEVAALTRDICQSHAELLTDWLNRSSEGNPYVLVELVRHIKEKGIVQPDGQVDLAGLANSPIVPQSIYTLTQTRLSRLSEPARRVLDAAVAAGREFEFDIVYHAAGLSEAAALDALDELRAAGRDESGHADPGRVYRCLGLVDGGAGG